MSDILQRKALSNKIEEALNEKVIGEANVEYIFDPSVFGMVILVTIDDPSKNLGAIQVPYYLDPKWHYRVILDEFIIKNLFDNEEETSKLISEVVGNVLDKYKEHIYKRYFFD